MPNRETRRDEFMSVMYVALPVAIALGATAVWACVRAIGSGQFDDLESPPMRMLIDDAPQTPATDDPSSSSSSPSDGQTDD